MTSESHHLSVIPRNRRGRGECINRPKETRPTASQVVVHPRRIFPSLRVNVDQSSAAEQVIADIVILALVALAALVELRGVKGLPASLPRRSSQLRFQRRPIAELRVDADCGDLQACMLQMGA